MNNINITIWHNNSCSTSRKILDYLRTKNVNITIRNYQEKPPTLKELSVVLKKMKQKPDYIIRKKEKLFQELFSKKEMTEEEQLQMLHDYPVLIERPIVIMGRKAFLARPFDEFVDKIEKSID
jgi:arsenate reductase